MYALAPETCETATVVRLLQPDDGPAVVRLWYDACAGVAPASVEALGFPAFAAHFERVTRVEEVVWVAARGGAVAGFVAWRRDHLRHLFVAAEHRRRGVGSALLGQAKRAARGGLYARTLASNAAARAFYERGQFSLAGLRPSSFHGEVAAEYSWTAPGA